MEWAAVWLLGSILVAVWAHAKGRSAGLALAIGLIFSPVMAAIVVAVWTPGPERDYQAARAGRSKDLRVCPQCAEMVRVEAMRCKHCGAALSADPTREDPEETATRRLVEALERRKRL